MTANIQYAKYFVIHLCADRYANLFLANFPGYLYDRGTAALFAIYHLYHICQR